MTYKWNFILGSQSPRRKELLEKLGISFRQESQDIDEIYPEEMVPQQVPIYLAELKSKAFESLQKNDLLITSDTVVIFQNEILGKPSNKKEAQETLTKLSNQWHEVVTGVCLRTNEKKVSFADTTRVKFKELSQEEIDYYIDNFHPFDKAGSYGIQDWFGVTCVDRIEGCYFNVMGLPVRLIYKELGRF
ncbi:MAG: septum formation protein Maf [Crocinitomicaceae bacterium]|nr:septum formation protein Maf [Crocinitomicaceae bacterium]